MAIPGLIKGHPSTADTCDIMDNSECPDHISIDFNIIILACPKSFESSENWYKNATGMKSNLRAAKQYAFDGDLLGFLGSTTF